MYMLIYNITCLYIETIPKSIVSNYWKRGGGGGPAETFLISPIYFSKLIYKYFSAGLKLSHSNKFKLGMAPLCPTRYSTRFWAPLFPRFDDVHGFY